MVKRSPETNKNNIKICPRCKGNGYITVPNKSVEEIKSALERDNFMTAEVAKAFGLIDEVVEKRS